VSARGGFVLLVLAALAGGLVVGVSYSPKDGLLTAAYVAASGALVVGAAHMFARRRRAAGSLSRQFTVAIALTVGLATVGLGVVALLMLLSNHDLLITGLLLTFAGALTWYATAVVARDVLDDIESVRDGLRAVGGGRRDVRIDTTGGDELAELAAAANRMTAQLAEREAERDAADRARRELVAAGSHDLRTPLTSLRLLADAIEDDLVDPETRRRYLEQMSVHIRSLSVLVEDLFELSRLEAGEIQWSMQRVRLGELVEETVEAMRPAAATKRVAVRASVDGDLAPARANPEKLQHVLFNLIQNAIRHTPADGSVTVAAEARGGRVEIEVADTGQGVAVPDRARVFEPFFRGGERAARSGGGTGLGLTICRAIVEAHGGDIWLADSLQGTRVRFSLPSAPREGG
jgi:signal transduction histidine kinase